ncbi:MAG: type III-A CRISPR-associated protein Csm2 [Cytophagales bacterium]|nr:type III-A CRISPR-associated protein Csm2 [Bernardetiaceae bacterium]MDW8211056.1 type III-A CRISPR-associated protein Csm2 [Cytophagales bacterium]
MSCQHDDERVIGWICNGIQNSEAIEWARNFAKHLLEGDNRKKLTTSQLRRFFGQLKRLQAMGYDHEDKQHLLMLKPQLAYAAGRADKDAKIRDFARVLERMITEVEKATSEEDAKKRFQNFVNLTEAIVAYHKIEGGS